MAPPPSPHEAAPPTEDTETYMTPGVIGACLTIVPNATLWYGLSRGRNKLEGVVKTVIKYAGVPGLLAVPFCGMAAEKCFYDSLVSLQGVNPNVQPENRKMESFPAVGRASRWVMTSATLHAFRQRPIVHLQSNRFFIGEYT